MTSDVRRVKARAWLGAILFAMACSSPPPATPTHIGYYVGTTIMPRFLPCNEREYYWVDGKAADAVQTRARRLGRGVIPVYVELIATADSTGNRPPGYTAVLRVDSLLPSSPRPPAGCRFEDQ